MRLLAKKLAQKFINRKLFSGYNVIVAYYQGEKSDVTKVDASYATIVKLAGFTVLFSILSRARNNTFLSSLINYIN